MTKHHIEIDEDALVAAGVELGTSTVEETVNAALRRAAGDRVVAVERALDALADMPALDRAEAWR